MQLTTKSKQVERKPLSAMESLYLPAIFKGMAITFSHMFKKKPTVRYPEENRPFPSIFRGLQILNRDEEYAAKYEINMLRCIFCGLCEEACPKDAVYLTQTVAPANYARKGFIYGKEDLLIPNPKTDPEGYAKAKGTFNQNKKEGNRQNA